MKNIRVLIVDDEPIARRGVRSVISQFESAEIVGESGNGIDAVEKIHALHPDIVFLDIRMPEKDGFEVVEEIGAARMPIVIFATAFDEYALQAFDAQAVDYVLKPFDPDRLRVAYERAESIIRDGRTSELEGKLTNLLSQMADRRGGDGRKGRLVVRDGGRILFIDLEELVWIESAGNYVKFHVGDKSYLQRETMRSMEERLPDDQFVRISRSALVNLNHVKEFRLRSKGSYVVHLRQGGTLVSSRHYRENIERAVA
jgi:two-component system LytT family response regulator